MSTLEYGTSYPFREGEGGAPEYSQVVTLDSTHVLVCWYETSPYCYGKARVGTISEGSISYGSTYNFSITLIESLSVIKIDSTHAVIAFAEFVNNDYNIITSRTLTISNGNQISYGTNSNIGSGHYNYISLLDSTHFTAGYSNYYQALGISVKIGTISGTTISYGSEYIYNNSYSIVVSSSSALDSTHVFFIYAQYIGGLTHNLYGIIGTISGGTISFGSSYIVNNYNCYSSQSKLIDSTHILITYLRASVNYLYARVVTISNGNQISYGTEHTVSLNQRIGTICLLDSTHAILSYYGNASIIKINGTGISSTSIDFPYPGGGYYNISTIDTIDATHAIISYVPSNQLTGNCVLVKATLARLVLSGVHDGIDVDLGWEWIQE